MKKNDYVYILQCEGCLSTESFHDILGTYATEEDAEKGLNIEAFTLLDNIYQYADFDNGYDIDDSNDFWEIKSVKWPDLYIRYFYERVLVQ